MKKLLWAVLLVSGVITKPALAEDVLHIYNWNNYIAPETMERFKQFCKCKVVYDTYGDNDELLAKLAAGAKGYDILVPTQNAVETLIKQKQLQKIDHAQVPNLKNINPAYLNREFDPNNQYSVPYAYTVTLIGFNEPRMKELNYPTDSWAAIFDPKLLAKIKGKITVLDSPTELFAAAYKYLGYSINDTDPAKLAKAKEVILKAKPYWAAFNNTSYIPGLAAGNLWLVHGYSNDMFQANLDAQSNKRTFTIGASVPKEGAVFALDNMVIHKSAPRPDLAHKFINFMLDGKNSSELTNLIGSGNPNTAAQAFIKPEIKGNKGIFPDQDLLKKLEQSKDVDAKSRRERSRAWTAIKAAKVK